MSESSKDGYCSQTVEDIGQGTPLAQFLVMVFRCMKALHSVFRRDQFLVVDFNCGRPLGVPLNVSEREFRLEDIAVLLSTVPTEFPDAGSLLLYIADEKHLQRTIDAIRPAAVVSVFSSHSGFTVCAQVDVELCPDRFFLGYLLGNLSFEPSPAASERGWVTEVPQGDEPDLLVTRLCRIVQAEPERIALRHADRTLTYSDIWSLSDRLASELVRRGGRKSHRMLIAANRSTELIICLLAALKVGIAFSIVDSKSSRSYIRQCARTVSPQFFVNLSVREFSIGDLISEVVILALSMEKLDALPLDRSFQRDVLTHDDIAVITFTSGSSNAPKGVAGRYGSLTYFFDWMNDRFGPLAGLRFGMCSSIAHDPLQRDIFTPLYCRSSICIPPEDAITSVGQLQTWLAMSCIQSICMTPPLLAFFSEKGPQLPDLELVFFVGGALQRSEVEKLRKIAPNVRIVNTYGSTESQRAVSFFELPQSAALVEKLPRIMPIGLGMKDVDIVIWDCEKRRRCAPYQVGEIAIRSRNIALGYVNAPEAANRFGTGLLGSEDHTPFYMTGDQGYYSLANGVVFVGRTDSQCKINGHRVDLEQIAATCRRSAFVKDAFTILVPSGESKRLATFLVPIEPFLRFETRDFRAFLAEWLPSYMIPTQIETVPTVPLTQNGKVDTQHLRNIADVRSSRATGDQDTDVPTHPVVAFAISFVRERLACKEVDPQISLADIGIDSVQFVDLVAAISARFSFFATGAILNNNLSVSALAALVDRRTLPDPPCACVKNSVSASIVSPASAVTAKTIRFAGKSFQHFCSNSYLGLADHPELHERLIAFVHTHPSLASHGSMLINGYTELHELIEIRLRENYQCEAIVLYGSGYMANLSVIPCLVGPGDHIFIDQHSHLSLRDGCSMSGANIVSYAHNDPVDLELRLRAAASLGGRRLLISEAVFGLDGDIANLPELSKLSRAYDAVLLLDEASSLGQLGVQGLGIEEHFRMPGGIDVRTGTLAKAIPSIGGYAACTNKIARTLFNRRGAAFSTAISPVQAFVAAEGLQILHRDGRVLVARLHDNARQWRNGLRSLGLNIGSDTAIARIATPTEWSANKMFTHLLERGMYALPLTTAWTAGSFGIRTSVTVSHEASDIKWALEQVGKALMESKLGIAS